MTTPLPELLAGYVLGDLSPEEQDILEAYLNEHPEAQGEIAALEHTLSLVPFNLPESSPSPRLRQSLLDQPLVSSLKPLLTYGTAILVTIGGIFFSWQSYQMRQQIAQLQQTIQFPDNRLIGLKASTVGQKSMGSLIIAPSKAQGILVAQNLPQPPAGSRYALWIVDNRGKKVFCQHFLPDREGRVMVTVPIDRGMVYASEVVITMEPTGNSSTPKGAMVIQGTAI